MTTLREAVEFTFANRHEWIHGEGAITARINTNHVIRILGAETDVETIRPLSFAKLSQALLDETIRGGKKRSNGGVNRILAALSTVLNELYKNEMVSRKPAYKRLPEKKGRAGYYSEEEMEAIMAAALELPDDGQLLYDSILFAFHTGNRQGELIKIRWIGEDINGDEHECIKFDNQTCLFLDTKNGEDHCIKLHENLIPMLERRYQERLDDREQVFPWLNRGALLRRFKRAKRAAGIDDKRCWHHIRHTTGTLLTAKGVPLRTVMGVLNHKNITTTLRYAKNTDQAVANAIDLL